ncbi:MAG TPA: thiamine pyrophosphate-binding protein [Thermoanaerobaculia bacterium]|nr:thiamine pyrophosphate-binding protein [Thermoanaerobaculia bacterium]
MIRVADYIARALVEHGIRDVFMVTGGAAMHLNDAIGRNKELRYICCHHEQACAMAAASYYRLTNRLAAINVTAGPGGTNAITGVFGAYVESLGLVVVSGQVKFETTVRSTNLPLRQLGDQEIDITRIVAPITKYAVMLTDPESVRYHVEKAIYLAREGRPGPVWLDVPMNIQGAMIDPDAQQGFTPEITQLPVNDAKRIHELVSRAERPVIFAGSGIRLAGGEDEFLNLVDRWKVPVVTGFNAHDLLWHEHPCNIGRQGTIGDRAGNFAAQNADLLLIIGSRLTIRQLSYNWENFAPNAFKIVVDIDEAELLKPTIKADLRVHADARELLEALNALPAPPARDEWLQWCQARKERYPVVLPQYADDSRGINPYLFVKHLFEQLPEDAIVVTGDGTACVTTFQAAQLKRGQRLYSDGGCAPMGFDLPAAIGACIASGRKRVICLAGDGSIQMNIQELQTIATNQLPISIFVLNNGGYLSIRLTQKNFFPDNPVGASPESGVGIPNFAGLAAAYGLAYTSARTNESLDDAIHKTLNAQGPTMCEVFLDPEQPFAPKTSSRRLPDGRMVSAPLEDMFPFLDRDELDQNTIKRT